MMFVPILNTSISASWLILAIIVVRFVFKKMPKALTCVLWGLVAVRLICPFSIESPLSLIPSAETIPEEILYLEGAQQHDPVEFNGIEVPEIQEAVGEVAGTTVSQVQTFDVYGTLIWLAGMAVMLLYALISYLRLWHRVIVSINERDNIWICDQIDSPFILGVFRPRIYMPSEMAEKQAAYVIAHEQAHLHRHDHWWKPFGFLLLSVYWFNPLIWVAYILLSRDIELACDEKVIRSMETADKQAYSEALLVCSVNRRMIAACPLAFGEVGVKARVKSVLNYKKPAFWVVVGSVVLCAVVAVCFLTDPAEEEEETFGETVSWIYTPDGIAWHTAIHFNFRLEHTHIDASCDRGVLWDLYSEEKPEAQSIRFESGNPVCWKPIEEASENLTEDAEIVFTIYGEDEELFSGRLKLIRIDENSDAASYEAMLVEGEGLTLLNADNGFGGVITTSNHSGTFCNHMPGSYISTKWTEAPNPDPEKYDPVELRWDTYTCAFCGTPFNYNTGNYRSSQSVNSMPAGGAQLSEDDFEDPVGTAVKLLSRTFSFNPDAYESTASQNGDFWNITFDGEHHYVVELTPKLPYPQTLYEYGRVPPGGYGEVEFPVEGELVDIAKDALWSAYALKGEGAQIEVFYYGDKVCVQFIMSDTEIFQVRICTGDLRPSGILFFNDLETAEMAIKAATEVQEKIEQQSIGQELRNAEFGVTGKNISTDIVRKHIQDTFDLYNVAKKNNVDPDDLTDAVIRGMKSDKFSPFSEIQTLDQKHRAIVDEETIASEGIMLLENRVVQELSDILLAQDIELGVSDEHLTWDVDSLRITVIENQAAYALELRYGSDIESVMAYRRYGSYAISVDGSKAYSLNIATERWEEISSIHPAMIGEVE